VTATPSGSTEGSPSPAASDRAPASTPSPEPALDGEYVVHALRAIDELQRILATGDDADRADRAGAWLLAEGQWVGENSSLGVNGGPLAEYAFIVAEALAAHARGDEFEEPLRLLAELRPGIAALSGGGAIPTIEPAAAVTRAPGDVLTVTSAGEPWIEIVVGSVSLEDTYEGPSGVDVPDLDNVYVQFEVTYRALGDDVAYDPLDWRVITDGVAGEEPSPVLNGPEPALAPGTLLNGDMVTGWIVFEVPASGRVVASHAGSVEGDAPFFEVVLRRR
jgi:hypothetical protein